MCLCRAICQTKCDIFRIVLSEPNCLISTFCLCFPPQNRETQLTALMRMYEENEDAMCEALAKDLHKSRQESIINEVEYLRNDLRGLLMNLRSYAEPEYVSMSNKVINGLGRSNVCICSQKSRFRMRWTQWLFTTIHTVLYWWLAHGIIHCNWQWHRWLEQLLPAIVWSSNRVKWHRLVQNSWLKRSQSIWIMWVFKFRGNFSFRVLMFPFYSFSSIM